MLLPRRRTVRCVDCGFLGSGDVPLTYSQRTEESITTSAHNLYWLECLRDMPIQSEVSERDGDGIEPETYAPAWWAVLDRSRRCVYFESHQPGESYGQHIERQIRREERRYSALITAGAAILGAAVGGGIAIIAALVARG